MLFLILLAWAIGLFGVWGPFYAIVVLGLIIIELIVVFIRIIHEDNFFI